MEQGLLPGKARVFTVLSGQLCDKRWPVSILAIEQPCLNEADKQFKAVITTARASVLKYF